MARAKRQLFKPEGKKQSHQIYEDRREAVFLFVQFSFCNVRFWHLADIAKLAKARTMGRDVR